ncbi:MAG TPA: holo-ACP synthase [Thermoanaerobaculia bacterium]|nr:holo-ACP synthase [Thermoanaerobaculia bacterium]
MSIVGIGIDLCEVARMTRLLDRHGARAVARLCREGEADRSRVALDQHLAGLFAAKEAVLKALGTGWAQGTSFRQVEVTRRPGGAPDVRLHDEAATRAAALGVGRILLSITHEGGFAAAVAVLEEERGDVR